MNRRNRIATEILLGISPLRPTRQALGLPDYTFQYEASKYEVLAGKQIAST
jgi:hypothetical protein